MNIIFISTSIPPYPDMQSIRNMFLLKELIIRGHKVTVITENYKGVTDSNFENLFENIQLVKTDLPRMIKFNNLVNKSNIRIFKKIFNVAINYIAIPDLHINWNKHATNAVEKILDNDKAIDLIITSSGSYTAHITGAEIAKKYKIPWVAEYGDPWGLDLYGEKKKLNFTIEQKILKHCRGLIFTTQTTIDAYRKYVTNDIPYKLVTCGYDMIIEDSNHIINRSIYNICYTGVSYKRDRNLMHALDVVGRIKADISLNMVGTFSPKYEEYINKVASSRVNFTGRVSFQESLEIISKSDILLHIGNFGTMQVPGKTYIYLSSKKPILYIRQEEKEDPTYNVLKQFNGVVYCENNYDSINQALSEVINNYSYYKKGAEQRAVSYEINKYCWKNLASEFADFTEGLINNIK